MKEYIKYISLGIFVAFCVKILMNGISFEDAPVFAIVAGFTAYLVNRDEEKNLEKINKRLTQLEHHVSEKEKQVEELRSHVSSLKLGQQMRSVAKF